MKKLIASRGTSAVLACALLALVAGGGYALASGGSKTITLCVKKHGGTVYKAKKCKKGDKKLTINKQGPAGAKGTTGGAGPQGPSGVVSMSNLASASSEPVNTSNTPEFITKTITLTFDAKSVAQVTGTIDLAASNASAVHSQIGACYKSSSAPAPTMVAFVEPDFTVGSFDYFASTESGVIGNLAPGSYKVGFCAKSESANVEHGDTTATVIFGESQNGAVNAVSRRTAQR